MEEHGAFDHEDQGEKGEDEQEPDERTGIKREREGAAHWGLIVGLLEAEVRKVASLLSAVA